MGKLIAYKVAIPRIMKWVIEAAIKSRVPVHGIKSFPYHDIIAIFFYHFPHQHPVVELRLLAIDLLSLNLSPHPGFSSGRHIAKEIIQVGIAIVGYIMIAQFVHLGYEYAP